MTRGTVVSAGRNSAVGTTGFERRWRRVHPYPSGSNQPLAHLATSLFPGVKAAGAYRYHPPNLAPLGLHGLLQGERYIYSGQHFSLWVPSVSLETGYLFSGTRVHTYLQPLHTCQIKRQPLPHSNSLLNLATKRVIKRKKNITIKYERFGSHSDDTENSSECDSLVWTEASGVSNDCTTFRTAIFWVITRVGVISYRRFGT